MLVILAMTTEASGGHPLVLASYVAGRTLDLDVTALQFKSGLLVVVKTNVVPLVHAVAGFAFRTEPTLVHIVFLVATGTRSRCFAVFLSGKMTGLAFHGFVRTVKPEFGQRIMLERLLFEVRDVRCTPLVIGMAGPTDSALLFSVKPSPLLQIDGYVLVTIKAQLVLRSLVERHMATLALLFHLCMTTNHLTRHQR